MQCSTAPVPTLLRRTIAAGVVTLVAAVAWTADASAQAAPDAALVGQVPMSFASTCVSTTVDGADAAITCTLPEVASVTYARFPTPELADECYDEYVGEDGRDTGSDCADICDSESPYHTADGRRGRVTCSSGRRDCTLTWIDGATVATATDHGETPLYEWWDDLVGRLTEQRGRLACFEHDIDVDLVWTNKETHVLTRAAGCSPKAVYRYFQRHECAAPNIEEGTTWTTRQPSRSPRASMVSRRGRPLTRARRPTARPTGRLR